MAEEQRRLYRSHQNKVLAGICGGVGEYLNVDPTLVRIVWLMLIFFGGSGIILYLLAYFIMPEGPAVAGVPAAPASGSSALALVFGATLIVVGGLLLMDNLDVVPFYRLRHLGWDLFLPAMLILIGVYVLVRPKHQQAAAAPEPGSEPAGAPPAPEPAAGPKTLKRSRLDRKLFGICGGLGDHFSIDPTIVRLLYVIFTLVTGGAGVILYLIMFFLIPEEPLPARA